MYFEWDEDKRQTNIAKHQVDFVDAQALFDGRPVVATRSPYSGEERYLTTGVLDDLLITVVWTWRNTTIRVISARRASHGEARAYRALFGG
jgi:uncharacterized DUF497 family protein